MMSSFSSVDRTRAAFLAALLLAAGPSLAERFFVDATATGSNSGLTWEDAFTDLQPALDIAATGDEIWVACAQYEPTVLLNPDDPRSATYRVFSGVSVLGGFAGGETQASQRNSDPGENGCLLGQDALVDAELTGFYHIVLIDNVADPVLVDGFTIAGGRATGDEEIDGAGLFIRRASATLRNLEFRDHEAKGRGGAIHANGVDLVVENIGVTDSSAAFGAGVAVFGGTLVGRGLFMSGLQAQVGGGPAIYQRSGATVEIEDCMFASNTAANRGGAILWDGPGTLRISRCRFFANAARIEGGAIMIRGSSDLLLDNSVMVGNVLTGGPGRGGGIMVGGSGRAVITNSTIANNETSGFGGGIFFGADSLTVQNSIVTGNTRRLAATAEPNQIELAVQEKGAIVEVAFSIVEGGFSGEGNQDADPGFVAQPTPGDHTWLTLEDNSIGDVRIQPTSPAVDAGNNAADLDGTGPGVLTAGQLTLDADLNPRVSDVADVIDSGTSDAPVIDIGAFEVSNAIFASGFE